MTVCGIRVRVPAKITAVAAAIVTASFLGCSHADGPTPPAGSVSSVKAPPAATDPRPETHQEDKAVVPKTAGNVHLQPVTPDDYKKFIAGQKGKVVLVDFWATWCGPCREKFPQSLALAKKYGPDGLTVVSVCMDSPDPKDQEKALHFLQSQHAEITNLSNRIDDQDAAFGAFDIDGGALPHFKIYDRKGIVRQKFGGDPDHPFDHKKIERSVVAVLKEK
jgi:thiol-disulfide isomerase/thioredoxin